MRYGWQQDPYGLHEYRYFSQDVPTSLVRDGGHETYDEPPGGGRNFPNDLPPAPTGTGRWAEAAAADEPAAPVGPAAAMWATVDATAPPDGADALVPPDGADALVPPAPSPTASGVAAWRGRRRMGLVMVGLAALVLTVLIAATSGPSGNGGSTSGRPPSTADAAVRLAEGAPSNTQAGSDGAAPSGASSASAVAAVDRIGRPPPATTQTVPLADTAEPPVTAPAGVATVGDPTGAAGSSTTDPSPSSKATTTTTTSASGTTTEPASGTTTTEPALSTSTTTMPATPTTDPASGTTATGNTSSTSTSTTAGPTSSPTTGPWRPSASPSIEWQWELAHPLSLSSNTDLGLGDTTYTGAPAGDPTVYDIDGFDNGAATVAALHARGAHVICYIDVGTWENWRPDAGEFPIALLGDSNGWPGEQWLDTNPSGPDYATLQAIMTARFEMCRNEGYDAVEPDNLDGSENTTGFPLTVADGDQYAEWVANEVHSLGMSVAQKNFEDQSSTLEPYFDFVIEEQCFQYGDCSDLAPYTAAGKAVLEVEYSDQGANPNSYCAAAIDDQFSSVEFDTALDGAVRVPCA